jgi:DNA-binding SARP family transcriptional activator
VITIRTLGPVEVLVNGGQAPPELLWRKHLALLVYLAMAPGARSRDHLVGMLWSEKPEAAARHSLNEALRILRRVCGDGALEAGAGQVRLLAGAFTIDTAEFEACAGSGDRAGAAALVAGEFMEGFAVPGEWAFEEWLSVERQIWKQRSVEALVGDAEQRLSAGDAGGTAMAATWALRLDPASEAACRTAMRARALLGDRAGAIAVFDGFAARLRDDVGIAPSADTAALAERVRSDRGWSAPAHVAGRVEKGAESRRAPLVERDGELGRLVGAWQACEAGDGARLAILEGEPGCGRTRLLQELVERARLAGATTAVLRAVEGDRRAPWNGLVGLLRSGLSGAQGVERAPAAARASLAALLAAAGRGEERLEADGAAAAAAFSEILRGMAASRPVVIGVDDAHWLDSESLLALGVALRDLEKTPFFTILTTTSHQVPSEIEVLRSRLGRDLKGETLALEPLTGEGLRTLARWALPDFTPIEVDRMARRLATDSAGLPLLAVELLHAIALGLDLDLGKAAWPAPMRTLDQTLPADLPDTITAAIRVGFRRLTPDAQAVLAAAAILPPRVEPALLGRATALAGPALAAALDELEWSRWLHAESRGFSFVARIVRDVIARDMLTSGQRRRILESVDPA